MHACDALRAVSLSLYSKIVASGSHVFLMTKCVCRWKPFWVPRGDTFRKAYSEEWEQVDDDRGYVPAEDRSRLMSRTTKSEFYKRLRTTGGAPHVNHLVTVPPCRNRRGNLLENQTYQQISGSIQELEKAQYVGNRWAYHWSRKPVSAIVSIRNILVSFPSDYLCRMTKRSYLVMRKTSRPVMTVLQLG